jgi:hypothetical protein
MELLKKLVKVKQQMMTGIASLDISVVKHCNLNCKGCDHFSPMADEWYIDVGIFESNLKQLKKILKDKQLYELNLMGGEPFLHKNIYELCKIAREIFNETKIVIVTNGIIYNKSKSVWDNLFSKLDIRVSVSDYSDKEKQFYKLNLSKNKQDGYAYKTCVNRCTDYQVIRQKQKREMFSLVPCAQLNENGDLYSCIIPANIDILNKSFGCQFEVIEWKDFVNIYKVDSVDEIIKMNNKQKIPFCDYCLSKTMQCWGISKKDESEWIKQ